MSDNRFFYSRQTSNIPCDKCGGAVMEFSVPNKLWNAVVRNDGTEHGREYLCIDCFLQMVMDKMVELCAENKSITRKLVGGLMMCKTREGIFGE